MKYLRIRGFTLIEIIVVIALLGMFTAFGLAMSSSSVSRSSVIQERDLFVTLLLRGARSGAIANVGEASHGIFLDNTCHRYILFVGTSFTPPGGCGADTREIFYTSKNISITHSSGDDTIVFEQLSGAVTTGAGILTIANSNATQEIVIRETGQIDW